MRKMLGPGSGSATGPCIHLDFTGILGLTWLVLTGIAARTGPPPRPRGARRETGRCLSRRSVSAAAMSILFALHDIVSTCCRSTIRVLDEPQHRHAPAAYGHRVRRHCRVQHARLRFRLRPAPARIGMRFSATRWAPIVLRAMVATTSQSGGVAVRTGQRDVETIRNFIASPASARCSMRRFIVVYMVVPGDARSLVSGDCAGRRRPSLCSSPCSTSAATNPTLIQSIGLSGAPRASVSLRMAWRNSGRARRHGACRRPMWSRWRQQWLEANTPGVGRVGPRQQAFPRPREGCAS